MPKYGNKLVVGLTGGIASGKTQVGKLLADLGAHVIDADQIAREVVSPGTEGLLAIASHFGSEYVGPDGNMDRARMGSRVFSDVRAREDLNRITHPLIRRTMQDRCRVAQSLDVPYIVYEAALLVEVGITGDVDKVVVVSASNELQVRRIMKRNQCTEIEALAKVESQFPLAKKLEFADFVVLNDNDREALGFRAKELHERLLTV